MWNGDGAGATTVVGTLLWLTGVGWDASVAAVVGALLQPISRLSVVAAKDVQNRWRARAQCRCRYLRLPPVDAASNQAAVDYESNPEWRGLF